MLRSTLQLGLLVALLVMPLLGQSTRADRLRTALVNPQAPGVFAIAHRGLVTEAPENSLGAIEAAIRRGCHLVELDVRRTRDGVYVLLHDATLDRTTTGGGRITSVNLEDVSRLRLLHHDLRRTEELVPTLVDAARFAAGRILLQLDPKDVSFRELVDLGREHGFVQHLLLKQRWNRLAADEISWLIAQEDVLFMPIVETVDEVEAALAAHRWPALEILVRQRSSALWQRPVLTDIARRGTRLWVNSLWDGRLSVGYGDHAAALCPEDVFLPLIDRGFTMIQSDEAARLTDLVKSLRLEPTEATPRQPPAVASWSDLLARVAEGDAVEVMRGGLHGPFPSDSLPALRAAVRAGAPLIRIPVRATSDGHLVLVRAERTDRLLTRSLRVSRSSLRTLRSERLMNGLTATRWRVPLLDEALDAVRGRAVLACDLQGDIAHDVVRLLKSRGPGDEVVLIQSPARLRPLGDLPVVPRIRTVSDAAALDVARHGPVVVIENPSVQLPDEQVTLWCAPHMEREGAGFRDVLRAPEGWPGS